MSYDLMVFDPDSAPRNRKAFMAWFEKQAEWSEKHGYDDPKVSTPALRAWFLEMIKKYPAMNGPYATEEDNDDSEVTDYSVGKIVIYGAFAWSVADAAHKHMTKLAAKHAVGFFDVSSDDGGVWLPDEK